MSQLRVRLLGPVCALVGDTEVELGPPRQRAVLAVLALRAGQVVSRTGLIEAVWGRKPPASAASAVYLYISTLRRTLGGNRDLLSSSDGGYTLHLSADDVDIAVFDYLCSQAAVSASARHYRDAVRTLREALALWRGEAFAGIPGPFADQERIRLAESRMRAVEALAAARLELGAHVELAAELGTLVQDHPLREPLRELLMIALSRSGRHAEALDVFQETRETLRRELGTEPGVALRTLHARILAGDEAISARNEAPLSVMPPHVAAIAQSTSRLFVGRTDEVAKVRARVADVLAGRGGMAWIEGDPGIGKSELLIEALGDVQARGCQLGWAIADEPDVRFPLRLILECLGISVKSPDTDRAELARQLRTDRRTDDSDPVSAAVDRMLALVDRMCAHGPVVLVIDDLQWADEASVHVWRRLAAATRQLPLLLVTCARTGHGRAELDQLRARATLVVLEPLPPNDVESLTGSLAGGRPGRLLRRVADRAGGNPLYLREMVRGLVRDDAVDLIDGVAHIDQAQVETAPRSLAAAVERTCGALPQRTHEVLRWTAVLGPEATLANVVALTGQAADSLRSALAEAVDANVVFDEGPRLVFRHPLMREAILGNMPLPVRGVLHREAARVLAAGDAPPIRVAEQFVAALSRLEPWVADWLVTHVTEVANHAPLIAADLLEAVLGTMSGRDPSREVLLAALVRVLFRLTRDSEARAKQALAASTDPVRTEEMRQLLAAIIYRNGRRADSIRTLTGSEVDPAVPQEWVQRRKFLLAHLVRDVTDVDAAEVQAISAYTEAVANGEAGLVAHALQTRWIVDTVRRDHETALQRIDDAIDKVRGRAEFAGMQFNLLDNKLFTLQNLDRMQDADATLRAATELVLEHRLPVGPQVSAAVHHYWTGRWDEALFELDAITEDGPAITYAGLMDAGPAGLLLHGVSALIAARRDDRAALAENLAAAERYLVITDSERESCDFLLAARAFAAVQRGDVAGALVEFAPVLDPAYAEMMLRHQWLPDVVRLALDIADFARVEEALAVAEMEAARELVPARAYAALHRCRALAKGDLDSALTAVEHYRLVGRPVELAHALEDAAVLLAADNQRDQAIAAYAEAVQTFVALGARWDRARAKVRLAQSGIGEPLHAIPGGRTSSWGTLSEAEQRIADMVANGLSNPDIATRMSLPRRIVQAHVVQIMNKLGVASRSQINRAS
ncbi:DNA-binding SARP family transcriptional activator/DNA-binding NarL/FixJ family response regulator [Kibdelosporangium banguiense]|uniref:DNA-binding SARP family transcriptional activator/DNA-binding NarL/FixJ family response regulator n=1 Tax=Kibdelosporangium banguiense TaxID=1365924 RepID=A0ABS4TJ14_9PSEU|nr:BTAD domain-containing putative transcriptional regulator [Kibdelosporangium banguiense]MBP2324407.1 DNA-binding SARP family transcriptional activator/DNA-binding NarL/FixJ family response regulator [Kibdelosporangium banguiense]